MAQKRTFVAADINEEVRVGAARAQNLFMPFSKSLRLVDPADMHLTFKFIGDWEEARLPDLCDSVERSVRGSEPFVLKFGGVGAFPRVSSPRVIVLNCDDDPPGSARGLALSIESELERIGVAKEGRDFKPHLTLARLRGRPPAGLGEAIRGGASIDAGCMVIKEVSVFLSDLTPGGPVYFRAASYPLGRVNEG